MSEQDSRSVRGEGADLHTHSLFSDGSDDPASIVEKAVERQLSAVALTDHDTVRGLDAFLTAAQSRAIDAIPGVEISTEDERGRYHILGYFIDHTSEELIERLEYFQEARTQRVRGMVQVLRKEGVVNLSLEEVQQHAGDSLVGKPHVAQALIERGVIETVREGFERFLGDGLMLDRVPKERMHVREAIELIKRAGGIPVLAHPRYYEPGLNLDRFREMGIEGLEVYYSDHTTDHVNRYRERARELNLLITGGSDFHGDVKSSIALGEPRLPETHISALLESRPSLQRGSSS